MPFLFFLFAVPSRDAVLLSNRLDDEPDGVNGVANGFQSPNGTSSGVFGMFCFIYKSSPELVTMFDGVDSVHLSPSATLSIELRLNSAKSSSLIRNSSLSSMV